MNKAGVDDTKRSDRMKRLANDTKKLGTKKLSGDGESNTGSVFEPAYSKCNCMERSEEDLSGEKADCEGEKYKAIEPNGEEDRCICAFDRKTTDAWPCYQHSKWTNEICSVCDEHAFCKQCKLELNTY